MHMQFCFGALMGTEAQGSNYKTMGPENNQSEIWSKNLPYTVPETKVLEITDFVFASKNLPDIFGHVRSSYMIIDGFFTVAEHVGQVHLQTPIRIPGGKMLMVHFSNSASEGQWMNGLITGHLVDA